MWYTELLSQPLERMSTFYVIELNASELPPVSFIAKHQFRENYVVAMCGRKGLCAGQGLSHSQHNLPWRVSAEKKLLREVWELTESPGKPGPVEDHPGRKKGFSSNPRHLPFQTQPLPPTLLPLGTGYGAAAPKSPRPVLSTKFRNHSTERLPPKQEGLMGKTPPPRKAGRLGE